MFSIGCFVNRFRAPIAGLACAVASTLFLSPEAVAQPAEISLAFWNVQWFPGTRPNAPAEMQQRQAELVLPFLEKLNPDILGLAEVRDLPAAKLAAYRVPGMKVDVCSEFMDAGLKQSTQQQVAIASRFSPISAWWEFWSDTVTAGTSRGFSFAAYEPRPGNILLVYAVHLKSNHGVLGENIANREETVRQFLDHQRSMEQAYASMGTVTIVLGGDFNTSAEAPQFRHETTLRKLVASGFSWSWEKVPFSNRMTVPAFGPHPPVCFDHVFVRGGTINSAEVLEPPAGASDHRLVMVKLGLPESNRPQAMTEAATPATPEPETAEAATPEAAVADAPAEPAPTAEADASPSSSPDPENVPEANASPETSPEVSSEASSL